MTTRAEVEMTIRWMKDRGTSVATIALAMGVSQKAVREALAEPEVPEEQTVAENGHDTRSPAEAAEPEPAKAQRPRWDCETDEEKARRDALFTQQFLGGMSFRAIGLFWGVTRGAISGRAYKLGLRRSTRRAVSRSNTAGKRTLGKKTAVRAGSAPRAILLSTTSSVRTCQWLGDRWRPGALLGLPLEEREAALAAMRCGAPTVPGTSWCAEHCARAFMVRRSDRD